MAHIWRSYCNPSVGSDLVTCYLTWWISCFHLTTGWFGSLWVEKMLQTCWPCWKCNQVKKRRWFSRNTGSKMLWTADRGSGGDVDSTLRLHFTLHTIEVAGISRQTHNHIKLLWIKRAYMPMHNFPDKNSGRNNLWFPNCYCEAWKPAETILQHVTNKPVKMQSMEIKHACSAGGKDTIYCVTLLYKSTIICSVLNVDEVKWTGRFWHLGL